MRSSSGRPKGYDAASITYSITPQDHTSAICTHMLPAVMPCLGPVPTMQLQPYTTIYTGQFFTALSLDCPDQMVVPNQACSRG